MSTQPYVPDPALDLEHAHAPFGGSAPYAVRLSVECMTEESAAALALAVADRLPVRWSWSEPDLCGCVDGRALAHLDPATAGAVERDLVRLGRSFHFAAFAHVSRAPDPDGR